MASLDRVKNVSSSCKVSKRNQAVSFTVALAIRPVKKIVVDLVVPANVI